MSVLKLILDEIVRPIDNQIKGKEGEARVKNKLGPVFSGTGHKQINNLILLDKNGRSHQIDHVEIRHNGIFCIETKNFSGSVYGSENAEYWHQYLGNEKRALKNPVNQNRSHINQIRAVLQNKYRVHSVIAMVQNNADKINVPYVVNLDRLQSYLKDFSDGKSLSDTEIESIYNTLINAKTNMTTRDHLENIAIAKKEMSYIKCPVCGGTLKLRNGRNGEFYGCSNYPKCKFTKNK